MSHHYVEFRNVTFRFPDGTPALDRVSFRVTHGESVGIVGANGSGKSTLLMHMNGYLMPTSGTVTIGDVLLQKGTARESGSAWVWCSRIPTTSSSCPPCSTTWPSVR